MDTGEGSLAPLSMKKFEELKSKSVNGLFHEGQELIVNGSKFVVHAIRPPKKIILKILPS